MTTKCYTPIKKIIARLCSLFVICLPLTAMADGPKKPSDISNPIALIFLAVIVGLLIVICLLAGIIISTARTYAERYKKNNTAGIGKTILILALCFASAPLMAQDSTSVATEAIKPPVALSNMSLYALVATVFVEIIIILGLLLNLRSLLAKEKEAVEVIAVIEKESFWKRMWNKMNNFKSLKEEASLDLEHSYDGIRELDNRLPPWWLYGFYLTIIVAVIYLWRYHVSHSAPSSIEEYTIAVQKAEVEKEAYLKKSAGNVDENTVSMLDATGIEAGKKIFTTNCAPCHGPDGGGVVGPNLTDDYWLHGGNIKDVFKTIKYGVPEKGMKSWKDDFSPVQIAQLSSFIKSLHGTKPATPKEPQGEIYKDGDGVAPSADSTGKQEVKGVAAIK